MNSLRINEVDLPTIPAVKGGQRRGHSGREHRRAAGRRPRVLMAGMHLTKTRGGISTLITQILASKLSQDYEIDYVATQAEDYGPARKLLLAAQSFTRFTLACLSGRHDLVHVHLGSNASLYREGAFIVAARLLGKRVLGHFHAGDVDLYYSRQPAVGKALIRYALRCCELLVACSEASAAQLRSIAPETKIAVVRNAIDLESFEPAPLRAGTPRILFVGAIGKLKGERDLLEALADMRRDGIDFRFSVLGYGAERLKDNCAELGIAGNADHLGAVPLAERVSHFRDADIFVLPTYAEAMPMSVIEAMAAGLGIVTTRVGGIPEIVEDGKSGLLVEPGDVAALGAAVRRLAADPELRSSMGREARRRAVDELGSEHYTARMGDLLGGMIGGTAG